MNFDIIQTLDNGLIISQCCDSCPSCDYVLCYADIFDSYIEVAGLNYSCCNNYFLNKTTYDELISNCFLFRPYDSNFMGKYSLSSWCNNGFNECINELETKIGAANFASIFSKGIVEQERSFSSSGVCFLLNLANELGITDQNDIYNFFDSVLNKGLVVKCVEDQLLTIQSIEVFSKFAELTGFAYNSVSNKSSNNLC